MARYLTYSGRDQVLTSTPAVKYKADGRGLVPTTVDSTALIEQGRLILPVSEIIGAVVALFRTRDPALISWTDVTSSVVITDAALTGGSYGSADSNGRYTVTVPNLRSTVPGVPALRVNATLPIFIRGPSFWGWGMNATAQTAMVYLGAGSNARFEETLFLSGKPPAGYNGAMPAHDICSEQGALLEVAGCESHNTRGTSVQQLRSPTVSGVPTGGVRLQRWVKYNVDGRRVDASGNWSGATMVANFVQFLNCADMTSGSYVEDYICRQDPVYGAQVEDVVSVYGSYCASGQTVEFRRFLVENVMPYDSAFVASGGTLGTIGASGGGTIGTSATGALMGDDQGKTGITAANVGQGFVLKNGTVLTFSNYGAAIQAGHDNIIDGITTVSVGAIRSAATGGYSRMAWTGGGGIHAWDRISNNDTNIWKNNQIKNSTARYYLLSSGGVLSKGATPIWDNSSGGCTFTNNTQPNPPATVLLALAELDTARSAQMQVFATAGTVMGLAAASPSSALRISTDP